MPSDRVPVQGHGFLIDQHSRRLMFIGSVNVEYTSRQKVLGTLKFSLKCYLNQK